MRGDDKLGLSPAFEVDEVDEKDAAEEKKFEFIVPFSRESDTKVIGGSEAFL